MRGITKSVYFQYIGYFRYEEQRLLSIFTNIAIDQTLV